MLVTFYMFYLPTICMEKKITFNLRLSKKTKDKLDSLADKYQISRAGIIRMLLEKGGVSNEKG